MAVPVNTTMRELYNIQPKGRQASPDTGRVSGMPEESLKPVTAKIVRRD
jgi:hypothetical protein